ncbi:major facilitator superfamily domain-containing protein [Penicillium soppii]|uniref:major facilitator superfamily domain-containing protein n=1 Tax=Penicillium soppii TaxID=69789 RepID=UPI002546764C|nr:major facilitator superfamily domain-containing protein [Penicillium soppii]KAJ5861122.1 major facilitator superfamily domain-containing protein [Penicillium soppii]
MSSMDKPLSESINHNVDSPSKTETEYSPAESRYSHKQQRQIIHKVDRRLITALGLLMCVSLVDRTNLGNAMISGMKEELQMEIGSRYSIVLLVFFVPYVLFQFPLILLGRKIGPRIFLSGITLAWGIVMICCGFVHSWKALLALRVLLGFFEGGLFPGAVYLLSMWYSRYDMHKRYSAFYLISVTGGAFSGLLAFGFIHMGGLAGFAPWRWIFIMEGLLTCVVACIGFALLINFPDENDLSWKFLNMEETAFIVARISRDRQDTSQEVPFDLKQFFRPALEPKVWAFALLFFCATMVSYSISFFLPIIMTSELHFSTAVAQVLTTPPYFFAGLFMFIQGWLGDKYRMRAPFIVWNNIQAIIGLSILGWVTVPGVQYFGIYLVAAASNANIPATLTYQANNIRGHWKRAFCSASIITLGGIGGVAGSVVFRTKDAPRYLPGVYACIA